MNIKNIYSKIDVSKEYNLPEEVRYCKKCVMSNQRPRIVFDDEGVCNACRYWERKDKDINWKVREEKLIELCDRFRRNDGRYDVIVPSSGGKDSAYVAHLLKYRYGMNPLTVTWAPHIYTQIGWDNFQKLINAGLDNILGTPNGIVHKKLTSICTREMGDPFQPFIYGQVSYPLHMAIAYDVQLIMDGENGEVEYGGDPKSEEKPGFTVDDVNDYWFSGKPIDYWYEHGFTKQDLNMYMPPKVEVLKEKKIERHFCSYYLDWRPQQHYYYCVEHTGFEANPEGRSEGTYSKYASLDDKIDPFHHYFSLLKFGYARATGDAAHEIREGLISREEGSALVQRYDAEFPKKNFEIFLDYCGYSEEEFWKICDKWRNLDLWEKQDGEWVLKQQVK
jgi:N-acetyl sugar amidotransferase